MAIEIHTPLEQLPTSTVRYIGKQVNCVEDPSLVMISQTHGESE